MAAPPVYETGQAYVPVVSDDPVVRILTAIERLRVEIISRIERLEAAPAANGAEQYADIVAHIQNSGDVPGEMGSWIGVRRSRCWIEGFCIEPWQDIDPEDLVYRAVLGRDWLSPWVPAGKYCGSQGLALPLRGFCLTVRGAAAQRYDCHYSATFVDGSELGSLAHGQICASATFAPLESFQIVLRPRAG
jgi:hypothetical protein